MKVKLYGTRGSIPVSSTDKALYGGNTTSVLVKSECLPKNFALVIDTGSGFVPLSNDILREGVKTVMIFYTHYHFDHTIGLTLSPVSFIKQIKVLAYGPKEQGIGPEEMAADLFKPPYFPVEFKVIKSHFHFKGIDVPDARIFIIHPKGGIKYFTIDQFERFENDGKMIPFDKGEKYALAECLVIKMHKSNHPERTISYRIEERPTDKVFVFLTDHENQDALPQGLLAHVKNANLLIMDAQYDRETYEKRTGGYGHGTPDYCIKVAMAANAKKLGFTHHDPGSSDTKIEKILTEGKTILEKQKSVDIELFACKDYQEIEL